MKISHLSLILFLCMGYFCWPVLGDALSPKDRHIPGHMYFETVRELIQNAKHSLHVLTYHMQLQDLHNQSEASKTLQSLVLAHLEGLDLKLILPENTLSSSVYSSLDQSKVPYQILEKMPYGLTLLVVDQEIVLSSSMPFADPVENSDIHHATLVYSKELALSKINVFFEGHPFSGSIKTRVEESVKLKISLSHKRVWKLYKKQDKTAFSLYLNLLYVSDSKPSALGQINENDMQKILFSPSYSKTLGKEQLKKALNVLQDLKLIEYQDLRHNQFSVSINPLEGSFMVLPTSFFTRQHFKHIDLSFFYVYGLAVEHAIHENTYPFLNEDTFTASDSMHREIKKRLSDWIEMLEKEGFLEKHLPLEALLYQKPKLVYPSAVTYPMDVENKLKTQYGEKLLFQAKVIAAQFKQEKNIKFINSMLPYLTQLGLMECQKICFTLSQLPLFHPERTQKKLFEALKARLPEPAESVILPVE